MALNTVSCVMPALPDSKAIVSARRLYIWTIRSTTSCRQHGEGSHVCSRMRAMNSKSREKQAGSCKGWGLYQSATIRKCRPRHCGRRRLSMCLPVTWAGVCWNYLFAESLAGATPWQAPGKGQPLIIFHWHCLHLLQQAGPGDQRLWGLEIICRCRCCQVLALPLAGTFWISHIIQQHCAQLLGTSGDELEGRWDSRRSARWRQHQ